MFTISSSKLISLTRGDIACMTINVTKPDKSNYTFKVGDIVRFKVFESSKCDNVVLSKDVLISEESETVDIYLSSDDTRIGGIINKPKDYWYEIELNPDTSPQTVVGYDANGPKIFRLYPEGGDGGWV